MRYLLLATFFIVGYSSTLKEYADVPKAKDTKTQKNSPKASKDRPSKNTKELSGGLTPTTSPVKLTPTTSPTKFGKCFVIIEVNYLSLCNLLRYIYYF